MKRTVLAIAILALGLVPGTAEAQKIGFVVSPKIFQEYPDAMEAQRKMQDLERPLQDSLTAMAQDIQVRIEEFQQKEGMMNEAAKRAATQEIQTLQRRATEWSEAKRRELIDKQEKILAPVRDKIKKAIEAVAKEEKYTFVFDKNETETLIYGDTTHDLTFKVLDRLKRGTQ
ncbi:MAG: OmpH family outer membrane protein [Ignavibacteria bacterium]|nr:OmpH family outer membrane protein [Ignavibacteria bacterium]